MTLCLNWYKITDWVLCPFESAVWRRCNSDGKTRVCKQLLCLFSVWLSLFSLDLNQRWDHSATFNLVLYCFTKYTQLNIYNIYIVYMEKEMATHSSVLAWRIPGMAEPGGLPSMGSSRVRHDWSELAANICNIQQILLNIYNTLPNLVIPFLD